MSSSSATTTKIINCKVENLRPRFHDLQKWIEADPVNHVYIGRPGVVFVDGKRFPPPSHTSSKLFGNPFKINKNGSRAKVISDYRRYALERMKSDQEYRSAVLALKGKILGCWCAPLACHGDVLKEIAETMKESDYEAAAAEDESNRIRTREDDKQQGQKSTKKISANKTVVHDDDDEE